MLTKKSHFFGARSPSKLVYIRAEGVFSKFLGSVSQKWISQNSTKGDPLGRQGVESLRRGRPLPALIRPRFHALFTVRSVSFYTLSSLGQQHTSVD